MDAPLTAEGIAQAELLADFFTGKNIDRIIASEYLRAQQTITPLAERAGLPVEVDRGLGEYVLSGEAMEDWLEKLQAAFADHDIVYTGGESVREATLRGAAVVDGVLASEAQATVLVSHGGMTTFLLQYLDNSTHGFDTWKGLSNPDVYCVSVNADGSKQVKRVWA